MAIKLVDELKAMGNFPIAHAEGINLVKTDGTEDNLQNLFNNGELGGGDDSTVLTQEEYEALPEEQKLDGLYYTYDTKRIYKNGIQYGASEPIPLTMEEYKALKEAGAIDEQQEYLIVSGEQGILLEAVDIGYNNAESGIQATTVQGAIDKVVEKVDGVETEVKGSIEKLSSNLDEKVDYKAVVEDGTRYVEDIVTQDINTWLPNNNSSIVVNLKKANGANYSNFQLLCNKQDSKNWTCIVIGGVSTFWRICYVNGVRYIEEIATMDKVESKYEEATLATPVDWNTLNTKARYYVSGGAIMTNAPIQQPFGELVVETAGDGSVCRVQKFFSFDGRLYMRRWTGSVWNEWYKFDGISI